MTAVLADTATIIWWLSDDPQLSETAVNVLQEADESDGIHVSAITLVDVWYATNKRNDALSPEQLARLDAAIADPEVNLHVLPITDEIARLAWRPPKAELPDPFDRLIVATARAHEMTLVSPDRLLRSLACHPAIW
ncbi:hypothetical protein BH20ACT4_BH20ACT4_04250 [soil metagenome]